jgi:hypothetical protein
MDREFNDGTIGYIVRTNKSLREKEESVYEVTPESPQGRQYRAAI